MRDHGSVPISLVTGPANSGKANVVLDAVRAHSALGREPLLVVPTAADQARYRRELASGGVVLGVRVERFEGLLAEAAARAGIDRAAIGPAAREHTIARLSGARPGLAAALAHTVAELETRRIAPSRLRAAVRTLADGEGDTGPAAEARSAGSSRAMLGTQSSRAALRRLCDVYERYRAALEAGASVDRELRAVGALDALRRTPALWGQTPVLLYGFDDLTELQLDAVETIGAVVDAAVTVSLTYEPGRLAFAGRGATFQRLLPLAHEHTELEPRADYYAPAARVPLHHLERSLLDGRDSMPDGAPARVAPQGAVRLLQGGSPRAELELVAEEASALLAQDVPAHEIAIVHRSPERIAGLLAEVLEDHRIPFAMRRRTRFAETAIGRAAIGLLRCCTAGGTLDDLLAHLRVPGLLDRAELADRFEARARREGAVRAEQAVALWEREHWPLDRLRRLREAAGAGAGKLLDAVGAELERLFGAPHRAAAKVLGEEELREARALAGARATIEQLRAAARLTAAGAGAPEATPALPEPTGSLALAALIDALERLELASGESYRRGCVCVADPLSLRARRVRALFACGLVEGVFPAPGSPHPLVSEHDRRALAQDAGLVLPAPSDRLAGERYLLYALCSRPEERLTLSWHVAGEDGVAVARSLFVDDVCDLFDASLDETTIRRPALGTRADADRMGGDWAGQGEQTESGAAAASSIEPSRPPVIEPLRDARVLGGLAERKLWSASSLEAWSACPVKWFVERFLRCSDLEPEPEPIARGALAHAALRSTFERLREQTGSARLTPAVLDEATRLLREALEEHETRHPLSVAPERLPGARRRLQVDLERYLESACAQGSPLEPTYFELEFGFEEGGQGRDEHAGMGSAGNGGSEAAQQAGQGSLPALDLGGGVWLRGRIDRVDLSSDGQAVVYDYKGRNAPPGARWAGDGALQVALYMRAVQRLLGHAPAGGFYQPLAGRELVARGVLDQDSGIELDCVRTDRLAHEELEALIEQCVAAARNAAAEARSGALEPRPDTCAYGGGCSYPTICRCER